MKSVFVQFQVFFEEPFWVGLWERMENGNLSVCKILFGSEPKEPEILAFVLSKWHTLKFSPCVEDNQIASKKINPKRMQRNIKQQIQKVGIGTKSQQALKLQQEQKKTEKKHLSRERKIQEKQRKFSLKQQKKKDKRKGK